jgi:hypothetical protein
VFINCPFDKRYLPILRAIAFAVLDCGFAPQLAIQEVSGRVRLEKILDLMRDSRLSIHDISRLPVRRGDLPRFNMPFECGLFVGMKESGAKQHASKQYLVLDAKAHRHQKTLSDAAGLDPQIHSNKPVRAVNAVRHFLGSELRKLGTNEQAPGAAAIWLRYQRFLKGLPGRTRRGELSRKEWLSFDYLPDLIEAMQEWLRKTEQPRRTSVAS